METRGCVPRKYITRYFTRRATLSDIFDWRSDMKTTQERSYMTIE